MQLSVLPHIVMWECFACLFIDKNVNTFVLCLTVLLRPLVYFEANNKRPRVYVWNHWLGRYKSTNSPCKLYLAEKNFNNRKYCSYWKSKWMEENGALSLSKRVFKMNISEINSNMKYWKLENKVLKNKKSLKPFLSAGASKVENVYLT